MNLANLARFVLLGTIWGTSYTFIKMAVDGLGPSQVVLFRIVIGMVVLLGRTECGVASEDEERRLRLLTPAIKGYAAVRCPTAMEECMGSLGGLGYMEEVGIGRLIKDSLVERIWEGTVNVLALDLVRATKDTKTVESYMKVSCELLYPQNHISVTH